MAAPYKKFNIRSYVPRDYQLWPALVRAAFLAAALRSRGPLVADAFLAAALRSAALRLPAADLACCESAL